MSTKQQLTSVKVDADLFQEFKNKTIKIKERNLIQDIMESKNLYDLTKIKRRLQNNVYKFSDKNDLY
jgi:hypothetical protein